MTPFQPFSKKKHVFDVKSPSHGPQVTNVEGLKQEIHFLNKTLLREATLELSKLPDGSWCVCKIL